MIQHPHGNNGTALKALAVACLLALTPTVGHAACGISDTGEVDVLSNFFPSLELLAKKMRECSTETLKVETKLTTEHKAEMPPAFEAAKSPYDAAGVANDSIASVLAKGELMPLNALVKKYKNRYNIEDQMLIRFGEDIIAVAFQVNAQHIYYRKDLFEKYHLQPPKTYDDVLADLDILKQEKTIDVPFGAAYKTGWELGNEFVDIFLAMGGQLVDPATNEPAFNNDTGVRALALMAKLKGYMSPNALSIDFGGVRQQMQQGRIAIAFLWGDQASTMDDPAQSTEVGNIAFSAAPSVVPGGPAATCFWWDGYVIPKNLDGDADLTFRVLMEAMKPETVIENNDLTLWTRSVYKPTKYAKAVTDSLAADAPPYPMDPASGMAHSEIGERVGDALGGKSSAKQALDEAARRYRQAAVDQHLIK